MFHSFLSLLIRVPLYADFSQVLIVDEVSMLSGELLEKLNEIAQTVKNNSRRFGGIQLLLVGDFLQLPPVPDKGKATMFCFESAAWEKLVDHHCELQIVHRQANESFVQVRALHIKSEWNAYLVACWMTRIA